MNNLRIPGLRDVRSSRRFTLGWLRVVPSGLKKNIPRSNPLDGRRLNTPDSSVTYNGL